MLHKLLRQRSAVPHATASLPSGTRVYAIGDIHGCDTLLEQLLETIDSDDAARGDSDTKLIFLGDLVDRGPASAAVVERVRRLTIARSNIRTLMGNHEEIFLRALAGDKKALRLFCRIGGRETVLSYGMDAADYERRDYDELSDALRRIVPDEHVAFLSGLENIIEIGDYAFVHAGIRPGVPLAAQQEQDLRWIRDVFLDHHKPHARVIVHGHTIVEEPELMPHRIGIDTGAYAGGGLTALGLESDARWTLTAR